MAEIRRGFSFVRLPLLVILAEPIGAGQETLSGAVLKSGTHFIEPQQASVSRRGFVRAGLLGSCGLSLSAMLRMRSAAAGNRHRSGAASVIILWKRGGPSQHETWDPKPDAPVGRDHYPNVFSAALAGGGIQGGRVLGSSDSKGAEPLSSPQQPRDVLATVSRHPRIDTAQNYPDHSGRPIPVLPFGEPLHELL